MKKLDLRLIRMIKHSKGQYIAVTAVIIIGLLLYSSFKISAINLRNTVDYYYEENNFAHLYVEAVRIPSHAVKNMIGKYGIIDAKGRVVVDVPLKVEDDSKVTVRVISVPTEEMEYLNTLFLKEGDLITTPNRDALVIAPFALARNMKIGDTIKPQIEGKEYSFNIKGFVDSPEFIYLMENEQSMLPQPEKFGVIYIDDSYARQILGYGNSYNEMLIKIDDVDSMDIVKSKLERDLDKYGVKRIIKKDNQLSNFMIEEEIAQLERSASTVPIIFLGVAALILAVMISRMVKNDRMTIGVLKALGYTNLQIIAHYTKLSLLMGMIGGAIGTSLGIVLSRYMTLLYLQFFNIPMLKADIYYEYVFSSMLLAAIFCIFAGLWGTRSVMKIVPAESMRPDSPKKGKRIFLENITFIWKRISFSWKIVIRNIFRGKKKFVAVGLGIALTYSMTFLTVHLSTTFDSMFLAHYNEFMVMDYTVNFSRPVSSNVIRDIKNIIDVDDVEGKIEFPFELSYGWKTKVTNVIGLETDTVFYQFRDLNNLETRLPEDGIVISSNLAKFLGVSAGDTVKIKNYIPGRDDEYLVVRGIIKQSLGMNAYMNIDVMRKKLMDENLVTGLYINSGDDVKGALKDSKNVNSILSTNDLIETFMEFLELSIASISILLIFSGILGFAIIYNSTIMGINERKMEFSSLRVLGFTKNEIYRLISKENFIMTIFGIIAGIPIGKFMIQGVEQSYSTELYTFYSEIAIKSYVWAGFFTILFVVIAQLSTYRKIKKLDFIEALKSRIS